MPKLLYQGHGSLRFRTNAGNVIYVDPFTGDGYGEPADLILVTHQHRDHNHIELITKKDGCRVITQADALEGGQHNAFNVFGAIVESVQAYNKNHSAQECVGYILTIDGVSVYCSGDTSTTRQMGDFAKRSLDYAILCGDGVYNMDLNEAAECARLIGAKHNIPVHLKPGALFDRQMADAWAAPNKLILEPGQEVELLH